MYKYLAILAMLAIITYFIYLTFQGFKVYGGLTTAPFIGQDEFKIKCLDFYRQASGGFK